MSSIEWQRSNLQVGEQVVIPLNRLIDTSASAGERLLSSVYEGETKHGLIIRNEFKPGIGTEDPTRWHYRMFVSWESIYCGAFPLHKKSDGELIRANRLV